MDPVELPVPQVSEHQGGQRATEQAAVIPHRIFADAPGPVSYRRAVDDQRTADVGFAAARINVAQPPWQFPTMIGLDVSG
jgi:hypothetical protein